MLMMSSTPKISVRPTAMRAYTPPMRIPSTMACDISRAINQLRPGRLIRPELVRDGLTSTVSSSPTAPSAMIGTEPDAPAGSTWTNLVPLFCHWKMKAAALAFSPSESNFTGPCTVFSVTPLCR